MEKSEVLLYVTEDGTVKLEVAMEAETVWLNLSQLCELFQRDKSVISRHIKNIYIRKVNWRKIQLLHFLQQFKMRVEEV